MASSPTPTRDRRADRHPPDEQGDGPQRCPAGPILTARRTRGIFDLAPASIMARPASALSERCAGVHTVSAAPDRKAVPSRAEAIDPIWGLASAPNEEPTHRLFCCAQSYTRFTRDVFLAFLTRFLSAPTTAFASAVEIGASSRISGSRYATN